MCDATPGKENTRSGAAKIKSSAGVSARSNPVQSTEKNAPSTTRPSRIRFDIHRHSEEDQRPDLLPPAYVRSLGSGAQIRTRGVLLSSLREVREHSMTNKGTAKWR